MDDLLEQGIAAYKAGKRAEARKVFMAVVKQSPENERAWGWMYMVASDDKERIYCMKQALRINPANEKAKQLLDQLLVPPSDSNASPAAPLPVKSPVARKKNGSSFRNIILIAAFLVVIAAVASIGGYIIYTRTAALPAAAPNQSASTPTLAQTATLTPTATATLTATPAATATSTATRIPTPLPGKAVMPITSFATGIPWLPLDENAVPDSHFFAFNVSKPPFDNPLVRQAFLAATDRSFLLNVVIQSKCPCESGHRLATTFIPPATLGRDLFNEIAVPYNPSRAKELLAQAGYADPSVSFPVVTVVDWQDSTTFIAKMWEQNLGIKINVEIKKGDEYMAVINSGVPEIMGIMWTADYNDPDNFLRGNFYSDPSDQSGKFTSPALNQLIERAAASADSAERQALYIQVERLLCETEAALIPIYHALWDTP